VKDRSKKSQFFFFLLTFFQRKADLTTKVPFIPSWLCPNTWAGELCKFSLQPLSLRCQVIGLIIALSFLCWWLNLLQWNSRHT